MWVELHVAKSAESYPCADVQFTIKNHSGADTFNNKNEDEAMSR